MTYFQNNRCLKRLLYSIGAIFFALQFALAGAATDFVIRQIKIEGLAGISRQTVLNYMPVKVGDKFNPAQTGAIIRSLYQSGLFQNVSVSREGSTLIVYVTQRSIIGRINITGNKELKTDKIRDAFKKIGFIEGRVFNQAMLNGIQSSLKQEYLIVGKYAAKVITRVTKAPRNRVLISINIDEGPTAKIKKIQIIGNRSFSERKLRHQFKLSTTGLFSFFTHNDRYSKEKLSADLETLKSYYLDRGYLRFKVTNVKVSLSPDKSGVYITVYVSEGSQYHLSGYTFGGNTILPKQKLMDIANLKTGDIFSRSELEAVTKRAGNALGEKGYANAAVNISTKVDEKQKTVFVTFFVKPGKRVYVRHITFSDNYHTNDKTLRRVLLQQEGALFSTSRVQDSKRELLIQPYIRNVDVSTKPVSGKPNQVDVNYKIQENPSAATLSAGIGYSRLDKFLIKAGFTHQNIFGTGNLLGFNIVHSQPSTSVSLQYYNPFYTPSGIGRGFSIYGTKFNASKANLSTYTLSQYGFDVNYNMPIARYHSLQWGFGYENDILNIGSSPANEVTKFVNKHGRHFYQFNVTGGWTYQSFDRSIFPTRGLMQSAGIMSSIPISKNSLQYYKLNYDATYYHPLFGHFVGRLDGSVGYGNGYGRYDTLPFIKNYFAGGIGSVRGYTGNSLGPLDSNGDPIGGKFEANGTVGLVFPNPFGENLRTTAFIDGGNVYNHVTLNNLRCSGGIEFDWLSPLGMLNFSFAKAINPKRGDDTQIFDFTIGTSF